MIQNIVIITKKKGQVTRKKAFTWPWTRKKQFFKDGLKTFSDRD